MPTLTLAASFPGIAGIAEPSSGVRGDASRPDVPAISEAAQRRRRAWRSSRFPKASGAFLGALVLQGRPAGRSYLTGEIKLMTAIAALAAAFIRNERLAERARGADARRRQDEIARQIHRGLLPRHDPLFAGLDISGGFRAADAVGGDYYGYVAMSDGSLGIAIADVSGHGVGAALYMAIAKGALQSEARDILSAGDVLGRVNEVLASDFSATDMFATFVFARFLPDGRRVVWSNAGHNPPLLLRARRGGRAVEALRSGAGDRRRGAMARRRSAAGARRRAPALHRRARRGAGRRAAVLRDGPAHRGRAPARRVGRRDSEERPGGALPAHAGRCPSRTTSRWSW